MWPFNIRRKREEKRQACLALAAKRIGDEATYGALVAGHMTAMFATALLCNVARNTKDMPWVEAEKIWDATADLLRQPTQP